MKNIFITILLGVFWLSLNAQNPDWLWVKSAGGNSADHAYDISIDANGNVYVTGYFSSPTINFGTITLTNAGRIDFYIVKYDSTGNVIWAKSAGSTENDFANGVNTDASGNVYVTGVFFSPTITFGTTTLTCTGMGDFYIVKYDPSGNVLWAKSAVGDGDDEGKTISTDVNGNLFFSGNFTGSSIIFDTTTLTNKDPGSRDIFVVKCDTSGNVLWAKSAKGTSHIIINDLSTDLDGNVYVTGNFYASKIIFGTTTLIANGVYDMFVVKYNASGNVLWAKSAGSPKSDDAFGISTDSSGNVYVTGVFGIPSITFGTTTLTCAGLFDFYIVKYDSSGNVLWAKSAGVTGGGARGKGITSDADGNEVVTGSFDSPSLTFGTTTLTSKGDKDVFIVKYDASGNVVWAKSAGGNGLDGGSNITTDAKGYTYVTGYYNSTATFDKFTISSKGYYDIFLGKIGLDKNSTSIKIDQNDHQINIYPNPNKGLFTITPNRELSSIELYNLTGKLLYSDNNLKRHTSVDIDLSGLQKGIYFIRMQDSKQVISEKIIIQ